MEKLKNIILDNNVKELGIELETFQNEENIDNNSVIFKIIPNDIIVTKQDSEAILGKNLFYDVEFFKDYTGGLNDTDNVCKNISDKLKLKGSINYFQQILSKPIFCTDTLEKRQDILKKIDCTIKESKNIRVADSTRQLHCREEVKNNDKPFALS
jgi:hypothetical protein